MRSSTILNPSSHCCAEITHTNRVAYVALLILIALVDPCLAAVENVASRGVTVRLLVEAPIRARAVAVLFAGGHGALSIDDSGGIGWGRGNFLVRSAGLFRSRGIATAIIDAPLDRMAQGLYHFRDSPEHAGDVAAVIRHLRARFRVPVVLIGTSRGTESVANAGIRLDPRSGADAIVLTASMLVANDGGQHLLAMNLAGIRAPTLIAHHREDACHITPYSKLDALASRLTSARVVSVLRYEGGKARGKPCKARHFHGFHGIEDRVVQDIVEWLSTHVIGR